MTMTKKQVKKTEKPAKKPAEKGVTKDMLIGDIASNFPASVEVMFKHGLHCVGCGMVAFETLEQGCKVHGMNDKNIDKLIDEINRVVEKAKKS